MNVFLLAACHKWPHGSHVSGQEQKHFSSLGTKLYFHVNSSRKNSIVLTPNMAALSRGRNQEWFTKAPFWEIVKNCYLEDIIWPLEDTKFLFECGKISHSFASIYYIDTNKIPNHLTLFIYLFFFAAKGAINYLALASLSTGDLFKCEDHAKAHLGGFIRNTRV